MKFKFGLALLVLTSQAAIAAQPATRLGDLNFFPKKGNIYWDTQLIFGGDEYKDTAVPGTYFKNESTTMTWDNEVLYALADNLNFGASFNYDIRNVIENKESVVSNAPQAVEKDYEETGMSDITAHANYRLMKDKIFLDLIGQLTVGIGDRETGSATFSTSDDGNNKQGHHSVLLGVAAGQKISDFEWRVAPYLDYHLSGERKARSGTNQSVTLDTDSFTEIGLNLRGQYRFLKNLAVEALLNYARVSDTAESGNISGFATDIDYDSYNSMNYGLIGKYNFSESILLKAGVAMTSAYDIKTSTTSGGIPQGSGKKEFESSRSLMIGGEFLF